MASAAKFRTELARAEQNGGYRNPAQLGWLKGKAKGTSADADRLMIEVRDLEQQLPKYEALCAERPAGCKCLGLGGWGVLIGPAGTRFWQYWCSCPDAARYKAEWQRGARSTEDRYAELDAKQATVDEHFAAKQRLRNAKIPQWYDTFTFATFRAQPQVGDKLAAADAVEAFATTGVAADDKRALFLFGPASVGKSGLAVAALRLWLERGQDGLYCWVPSLFRSLKSSFDHRDDIDVPKPSDVTAALVDAPLLVLDDLGGEQPTAWTRSVLFELIGYRHDNRLPTIFTSNFDLATTAQRLMLQDDDPVESKRIVWRIAEFAEGLELGGRNLRQAVA